jgi:aromatic-amino-acid transaminase
MATRAILSDLPTSLLAYSCDKNFGLYRERVGALWVQSRNVASNVLARGNILSLARSMWSMPPDHGAAIVATILEDSSLRAIWSAELETMRSRINDLRTALAAAHPALSTIGEQRGMFAMLPLAAGEVASLRADSGIYMAGNGRINIAGLTETSVPTFVAAASRYL